jgi:hypothetical protein
MFDPSTGSRITQGPDSCDAPRADRGPGVNGTVGDGTQQDRWRSLRAAGFALLVAAGSVAGVGQVRAENIDGNKLLALCEGRNEGGRQFCLGFVTGIAMLARTRLITPDGGNCLPAGATSAQVRAVVVQALRQHPQSRHEAAFVLVVAALATAWPCLKT